MRSNTYYPNSSHFFRLPTFSLQFNMVCRNQYERLLEFIIYYLGVVKSVIATIGCSVLIAVRHYECHLAEELL